MSLIVKLPEWFATTPLALLRFGDGFESELQETRHGLGRFTIVKSHSTFDGLKVPSLCIAEMPDGASVKFYVGVVKLKAAVGTFDTRVTVVGLKALKLSSFQALADALDGQIFKTLLAEKLAQNIFAAALSPKLSIAVINALSKDPTNNRAIEAAAANIPKLRPYSTVVWEQLDAIKTAMAAFGIGKSVSPDVVEVPEGAESALDNLELSGTHVLEDNVIARDASVMPGFDLIEKHVTGRAVFTNSNERLVIYTANKGPLEEMLGVDLIYMNEISGNAVMVQYKMLTPQKEPESQKIDWVFRPDSQFETEVARMALPVLNEPLADYRMHRSPFFFKFVRRKGNGESHASFVVSLNHLNQFLQSQKSKGPKGGVRVSFESLEGVYLRDTDLIGLIRSGYIGTHRLETEALKPIIQAVSQGQRSLVIAWQKRVEVNSSP